jgi:2-polyprenyl-3-methyl-5-hydroxy-6-metoxy-1,4-benzoquinol methylase
MEINMDETVQKSAPKLVQTKWGFYQYSPLPSDEELQQYYANRYYQEGLGSYNVSYTEEEIAYFKLKGSLTYRKIAKFVAQEKMSVIDVGCGEGWLLSEFFQHDHSVLGLDFSKAGVQKFHPHLLPFLHQGNIYELLESQVAAGQHFDVVTLFNVIEHVKRPNQLLQELKKIMHKDSILALVAPNDFSSLHDHLMTKGFITKEWWLAYPDHLSYFNKENMCNFLTDHGFKVENVVADNPIDLNLLNDNSNYVEDEAKGKNTHLFRVRVDNFLAGIDADKLLAMYEILGSMGVGRDLTYYCSLL